MWKERERERDTKNVFPTYFMERGLATTRQSSFAKCNEVMFSDIISSTKYLTGDEYCKKSNVDAAVAVLFELSV